MLTSSQSVKYKIDNNGTYLGKLKISKFIKDLSKYKIPFSDSKRLVVKKIGIGNYDSFDDFIVASLNDYYKKMSNPSDVESKEEMLDNYAILYSLWEKICNEKNNNNYSKLSTLYNKISYGLYKLGYDDEQL